MAYVFRGIRISAWRNYRRTAPSFLQCLGRTALYSAQLAVGCLVLGRRVLLLFLIESWLREIDDAVDRGQGPSSTELLESKLDLLAVSRADPGDQGLAAIFRCADRAGTDVRSGLMEIVGLMRDELVLRGQRSVIAFQRWDFARRQDAAVLKLVVRVLGGDSEACGRKAMALDGLLTRTDWLNDLSEDVANRCFLFPSELERLGITPEDLRSASSRGALWSIPGFVVWYRREAIDLGMAWKLAGMSLRTECEAMFPRKLEARFFYWAIFKELEGEFRQAERRCPSAA